jgi:hypothetical protein
MIAKGEPGFSEASIVVASLAGEASLDRCVASIISNDSGADIIVPTTMDHAAAARIQSRYPGVRFIHAPKGTSVFVLRSLGIAACKGGIIALTEDHCVVAPNWLDALKESIRRGYDAVGGPLDNGLDLKYYDWALYFTEYSRFIPPAPEGPTDVLTGANVAYRSETLMKYRHIWGVALHENELHDALVADGRKLGMDGRAWAKSFLQMPIGAAMSHLYSGGRQFGGYRASRSTLSQNIFWVMASAGIPFALLGRIISRVALRRRDWLVKLALSLPFIVCLLAAWCGGELAGYVSGLVPGRPFKSGGGLN